MAITGGTLSRRDLGLGLAGVGAGLVAPAGLFAAKAAPGPFGGGRLPEPDFSLLDPVAPFVARTRPHRDGGIKLKLDILTNANGATRYVIHNYGHSGAGITMSWGCAAQVVAHCREAMAMIADRGGHAKVAVVGAGVIGLTSATEIRRAFPALPITVYAKSGEDVAKTTSFVAGGQFEPTMVANEYDTAAEKAVF